MEREKRSKGKKYNLILAVKLLSNLFEDKKEKISKLTYWFKKILLPFFIFEIFFQISTHLAHKLNNTKSVEQNIHVEYFIFIYFLSIIYIPILQIHFHIFIYIYI